MKIDNGTGCPAGPVKSRLPDQVSDRDGDRVDAYFVHCYNGLDNRQSIIFHTFSLHHCPSKTTC